MTSSLVTEDKELLGKAVASADVHARHLYDESRRAWEESDVKNSIGLLGNIVLDSEYIFTNAVGRSDYLGGTSLYFNFHYGLGFDGKRGKFCTTALSPVASVVNPENYDLRSPDLIVTYSSSGTTNIPLEIAKAAHEADLDANTKAHGLRTILSCITSNPQLESVESIPGICKYRWHQIVKDEKLRRDYYRGDVYPIIYVPGGEELKGRHPDYIQRQIAGRTSSQTVLKTMPEISQLYFNNVFTVALMQHVETKSERFDNDRFRKVLNRFSDDLSKFPSQFASQIDTFSSLLDAIEEKKRICVAGEGQSEYLCRSFVTRLSQLGMNGRRRLDGTIKVAQYLDNPEVSFDSDDLLIVVSGYAKGQRTIARHARRAREAGATVALITFDLKGHIVQDGYPHIVYPIENKDYPLSGGLNVRTGDPKAMTLLDVLAYAIQEKNRTSPSHSAFTTRFR